MRTGNHECGAAREVGRTNTFAEVQRGRTVCDSSKGGLSSSKYSVLRDGVVLHNGIHSCDGRITKLYGRRQIEKVQQVEVIDSKISGPCLLAASHPLRGLTTAGCGPSDLFWYRLSAATRLPSGNQPMYNDIVSALGKFVLQAIETARKDLRTRGKLRLQGCHLSLWPGLHGVSKHSRPFVHVGAQPIDLNDPR